VHFVGEEWVGATGVRILSISSIWRDKDTKKFIKIYKIINGGGTHLSVGSIIYDVSFSL